MRFALGKVEANFGTDGIRFLVHPAERHRFNFRRVVEIQGAKRHVDRVACHVAQRAGAEILPAAPVERLVNSISIIWIMDWPYTAASEPVQSKYPNLMLQEPDLLRVDDPLPAARLGGSSRRELHALVR